MTDQTPPSSDQPARPSLPSPVASHRLRLFIGPPAALARFVAAVPGAGIYELTSGAQFLALPFDDEIQDALHTANGTGDWGETSPIALSTGDLAFAALASRAAPLAYLETDYEGQEGTQAAALWLDGELIIPPLAIDTATALQRPPSVWPINAALRGLGVVAKPPHDEFTSFGLRAWTSNAEIRARARRLGFRPAS